MLTYADGMLTYAEICEAGAAVKWVGPQPRFALIDFIYIFMSSLSISLSLQTHPHTDWNTHTHTHTQTHTHKHKCTHTPC